MNRIIRQKSVALQERVTEAMEMMEHPQDAARWEDAWDELMSRELGEKEQGGGFRQSSKAAVGFAFERLKDMRLDSYARGAALHRLVEEERALRDRERVERRERRRREREGRKRDGVAAGTSGSDAVADLGRGPSVEVKDDGQLDSAEMARKLATQVAESEPFIDTTREDAQGALQVTRQPKPGQGSAQIRTAGKGKRKEFKGIKRIIAGSTPAPFAGG